MGASSPVHITTAKLKTKHNWTSHNNILLHTVHSVSEQETADSIVQIK